MKTNGKTWMKLSHYDKEVWSMKKVLLWLLWGIFTAANSPADPARVLEVTVEVKGLDCPACASGMRAGFERLDFVSSAVYQPERSSFTLSLKPDRKGDLQKVLEMVRKNGFTPGEMRMKGKFRMEVTAGPGQEQRAYFLVSDNLIQKLRLEGFSDIEKDSPRRDAVYEMRGRVEPLEAPKKRSKDTTVKPQSGEQIWKFIREDTPGPGQREPEKSGQEGKRTDGA